MKALADLRGAPGTYPPGPNSFNFMQFWGKNGQIIASFRVGATPRENPGSATGKFSLYSVKLKFGHVR